MLFRSHFFGFFEDDGFVFEAVRLEVIRHVGFGAGAGVGAADPQAGACPVQGNLDPALLAAPWPLVAEEVDAVLAAGRAAPGHVVNLGHGVPPTTDADVLTRIVARVHGSADWESVALAGWQA